MTTPQDILDFWIDEVGQDRWYDVDEALDTSIRARFAPAWEAARDGGMTDWLADPRSALAYIILTDQFPRNMFRGEGRAFATDGLALGAAKAAIGREWDLRIAAPERQFFYLPLMHSENLVDQDRCVRLMLSRMPDGGAGNLLHARAHREVIRKFGRFPYRNDALGRQSKPVEREYLDAGAYGATVRALQSEG
ncbi:DUF924 family protein [Profundibacterium mesophilum]|uniref:DUF924 domain-containing protein n=1 Tax=Profundibacterium mesophilum KAUST100406-0324 TaxID=1037889 RepID=A0A921TES5_9RHOB|nr:DUF924 family protein [Profundibacterium mesophilum]KAF0677622.1 uncharacterized protein PMES_00129 [Profundibacterium mesophilum KAUST100406-0324]